jgi:hypothetical protein
MSTIWVMTFLSLDIFVARHFCRSTFLLFGIFVVWHFCRSTFWTWTKAQHLWMPNSTLRTCNVQRMYAHSTLVAWLESGIPVTLMCLLVTFVLENRKFCSNAPDLSIKLSRTKMHMYAPMLRKICYACIHTYKYAPKYPCAYTLLRTHVNTGLPQ